MTRRAIWICGIALLLIIAGFAGLWGYGTLRRVDGRTAADWLAFAVRANRAVNYHAVGHTRTAEQQTQFTLDQSADGRYQMRTTDAAGKSCELGFDGKQVWCDAGDQRSTISTAAQQALPSQAASRIAGTGSLAGRPVVRLLVKSGPTSKIIAVDRETGVMLGMTTFHRNRIAGSMEVEHIEYHPVQVEGCRFAPTSSSQAATDTEIVKALGGIARPRWLPQKMTARGSFLVPCQCCNKPMAALRYSDGVATLTLFEMSAQNSCMQENGCGMTATGHDLVMTRTIGQVSVTAVGNLDAHTLEKVLKNLR